jgi:hypothetical protein
MINLNPFTKKLSGFVIIGIIVLSITNLSSTKSLNREHETSDASTHGELSLLMDYINANGYKNVSSLKLTKDINGVPVLNFVSENKNCSTEIFKNHNQSQFYSVEVKSISCKSKVTD